MITAFETHEFFFVGLPRVAPIVKTHLQRDLDCTRAIAAVEGVTQAGKFRKAFGKLDHRRVREACKHHVFELIELVFQCGVDARIGVTKKIHPPRRHRIQIALALEIDQPRTFATRNRHQRKLLVVLHLRAGMPHARERTRDDILIGYFFWHGAANVSQRLSPAMFIVLASNPRVC